jgi:hypothetical protein
MEINGRNANTLSDALKKSGLRTHEIEIETRSEE